jgi:predicted Zn-dependent protease
LLILGEQEAAESQLREFSELVPNSLSTLKVLADMLSRQGRSEEVKSIANKLLSLDNGKSVAHAALGRLYLQNDQYDDALANFRLPGLSNHHLKPISVASLTP